MSLAAMTAPATGVRPAAFQRACLPARPSTRRLRCNCAAKQATLRQPAKQTLGLAAQHQHKPAARQAAATPPSAMPAFLASFGLYLLAEAPAALAEGTTPFQGVQSQSLYVTLALFLISVPGIWSQVKRAPVSKKVRKTFEVPGPGAENSLSLDDRARQVFRYFKSYNYELKGTGEVITFVGTYAADRGQAAAVTFYTFCGMASIALVLSILVPDVGNWWYALTLLSPAAWFYYYQKGERQEEVKVKMVTADDDKTTDIVVEGDAEEIERFRKELQLMEKGKVYVKGLLE